MNVWRDSLKVIIGFFVTDVTRAYYLLDFSWEKEFLEFRG